MATSSLHVDTKETVVVAAKTSKTSKKVRILDQNIDQASHHARKGVKTYKRLRKLRGGASAIISALNNDLADLEMNELSAESDSDYSVRSDSSSDSRASRKNSRGRSAPRVTRYDGGYNDDIDCTSYGGDAEEDTDAQDEDEIRTHKSSSGRGNTKHHGTYTSHNESKGMVTEKIQTKDSTDLEKAGVSVTAIEIEDDHQNPKAPTEQPKKRGRLLVSRATSIARVLSWVVMIIFPLLFIGMLVLTLYYLSLH